MAEFVFLYRSTQEASREAFSSPERAQQSIAKFAKLATIEIRNIDSLDQHELMAQGLGVARAEFLEAMEPKVN